MTACELHPLHVALNTAALGKLFTGLSSPYLMAVNEFRAEGSGGKKVSQCPFEI